MDIPVSYLTSPAVLVNEAVDMLGQPGKIIGDITDGTIVAETARRYYGQGLRQLLRTAPWDFCRKQAVLQLLGDATTTTPAMGVSTYVEPPWSYCYAWPIDAVYGRWMPWNPTNAQPETNGVPDTTGVSALVNYNLIPGRYLVGSSDQYPIEVGTVPWNQLPDLQRTEGLGPISRKVILTNCCNASFVYTRLSTNPEEWDGLFRQALVTMLAIALAPTAIENEKVSLATRDRLAPILKNMVADARVANGNESGFPQTTDFEASFILARNSGSLGWASTYPGYGGTAVLGGYGSACGWDSMSWGGSVY